MLPRPSSGRSSVSPDSTRIGSRPRSIRFEGLSTLPRSFGNKRSRTLMASPVESFLPVSRLGHTSFHSRKALMTIGGQGRRWAQVYRGARTAAEHGCTAGAVSGLSYEGDQPSCVAPTRCSHGSQTPSQTRGGSMRGLSSWASWRLVVDLAGFSRPWMGKTRTGTEWVHEHAMAGTTSRIALVAPTAADVRDVLVEGSLASHRTAHGKHGSRARGGWNSPMEQ